MTDSTVDQVGRGIKGKSNGIVSFSTGLVSYPERHKVIFKVRH